MDNLEALTRELVGLILPSVSDALRQLDLPVIQPGAMRQNIARLRHHVPPAYLPFATFDGSPLAFYLIPGIPMSNSPVTYIATGSRTPRLVCGQFKDLARGAWLWVARYYKKRCDDLRAATNVLAENIAGGRPVPDVLWKILKEAPDYEPTWWSDGASEYTFRAWNAADVGHPFAPYKKVDRLRAENALPHLLELTRGLSNPAPELITGLVAAQVATGQQVAREDLLYVLSAEAWLGGEKIVRGRWSPIEEGLGEWSLALKIALRQPEVLDSTPFEALLGHPETYSGKDPSGNRVLLEVARRFGDAGDHLGELRQLRNAAFVSLIAQGGYSSDLCLAIAAACDRVSLGSSAATLARAYGAVDPADA
jgi:hypothetical protein